MNSTHAHFNISAREIGAILDSFLASVHHLGYSRSSGLAPGRVYFWWRHRFQIASFSPSTLENSVFKKHRFQIAPHWRAFSNGSAYGDRFRRCSVDDSRIRSKPTPFSFENELVWTGPNMRVREKKSRNSYVTSSVSSKSVAIFPCCKFCTTLKRENSAISSMSPNASASSRPAVKLDMLNDCHKFTFMAILIWKCGDTCISRLYSQYYTVGSLCLTDFQIS